MTDGHWPGWIRAWPFWTLGILVVLFTLMLVFSRKAPVITSLEPSLASPGEVLVVEGRYFGRTAQEGTLSLAGEIPPPSLIRTWTDRRIEFVVPEDAASGLVTIQNSQGTSPGVLFTNATLVPTVVQMAAPPRVPLIVDASPPQPAPGQIVTFRGRGFGSGSSFESVGVSLASGGPFIRLAPFEVSQWTDTELRFRWPAGVSLTSAVTVTTPAGVSTPFPLASAGPVAWGTSATVDVMVTCRVVSSVGSKMILAGTVPQGPSGTDWQLLSSSQPPVRSHRALLFAIPATPDAGRTIHWTLRLTTWARSWSGFPSGVAPGVSPEVGDDSATLWKPAQTTLASWASAWRLETADPWLKLNRLSEGLLGKVTVASQPSPPTLSGDPVQLVQSLSLTSYDTATLGSALAAQAGLPARVVSGIVVSGKSVTPRFWVQVWMAGAGWVDWDPSLGHPGTLDEHHFAFEVSPVSVQRLLSRSKTFGPPRLGGLGEPSGEIVSDAPTPTLVWSVSLVAK